MYKLLLEKGQTIALIIGLVVIAIFLGSVFSGLSSAGYDMSTDLNDLDKDAKAAIGFFNPGLYLTLFLAGLAGFLAFIFFGVMNIMKFPKSSTKALLAVVGLLVVFGIFYAMAGTEYAVGSKMTRLIEKGNLSDGVIKFIGGGINVTLLMAVVAVVIAIAFEIKNAFN